MSWFEVIKRAGRVGRIRKVQMKFFRPAVLKVFKGVNKIDSNNPIRTYLDEVIEEYERLLRLEYAGISNWQSTITQHINKYRNAKRLNAIVANILRNNGWEGNMKHESGMVRKSKSGVPRKGFDINLFRQAIKEASDKVAVDTSINFTDYTHETTEFLENARKIYARLTNNGNHAYRIFRGIAGRKRIIKSVLLDYGWDDEMVHKKLVLTKVI